MRTSDAFDDEPTYGEHGSAEAVIFHLAQIDHDNGVAVPVTLTAQRLLDHERHDGVVATAMSNLGNAMACQLYRDARREILQDSDLVYIRIARPAQQVES